MVLTLNFKLKLIYIILTFVVIYEPIEDFKGEKTWEKLPSQKSRLNIFFLAIIDKSVRGFDKYGTNYTWEWSTTFPQT